MASLARSAPILAAFAWATLGLQAQEVTFQATTDRNAITVGDPVRFTLELTNASGRITTPDWGGLAVLQGPSTSSNFSSVNGRVSRSSSTSWVLTATSPGDFTIGPSTASVGGGTLRSGPEHIHVTKAAAGAASSPQAAQGQKKDPNLFCTITLSKQKAWVGEQVIATYTLFSRYSSLQPGDYDLPKVSGFWAEEVDLGETNWEPGQRTVNGLRYNVAVLKKQVLIPLRGGSLRVEPMTLNYRVNPSFFNSGTPVRIQSNAVTLVAMELPPGKPADFMGAVGDIRLDVEAKGPAVKANEAVDLTIRFTGKANLKLIDAPQLSLPGDFEAFDPKIEDKITVNGAGMSGSRTFQYLLIPRHEGDYDIGALSFSYFDPASGSYKSLRSAPLRFQVAPGDAHANATISAPTKTEVHNLGREIRYIRTGDLGLRDKDRYLFGSAAYVAGMLLPPALLVLLFVWRRKRERQLGDATGLRRKAADKVAKQRLALAHAALDGGNRQAFHDALGKALEGYAADKFNLGVAEVTTDNLRAKLAGTDDGPLAERYIALIRDAATARFSPVDPKPRQQAYDEAVALIARMEQLLRR